MASRNTETSGQKELWSAQTDPALLLKYAMEPVSMWPSNADHLMQSDLLETLWEGRIRRGCFRRLCPRRFGCRAGAGARPAFLALVESAEFAMLTVGA